MRHAPVLLGLAAVSWLAACADPLSDTPRLSDVAVPETAGEADALGDPERQRIADAEVPDLSSDARPDDGVLRRLQERADEARATKPARPPGGPGLLSRLFDLPATDTARTSRVPEIAAGTRLPYGEIGRLCDQRAANLGQEILRYPETGRPVYRLYDSQPGSTGLRNFYLTGFDDRCARQFTSALVLFGDPITYERIRYGPAGASQPVSETDTAYETLKRRVCGARPGQPCGERISTLSQDTVFVSIYERFGASPRWKNLLVHDGEVLALDIKTK